VRLLGDAVTELLISIQRELDISRFNAMCIVLYSTNYLLFPRHLTPAAPHEIENGIVIVQ